MQNQFYKPENCIQFPSTLPIKESLPPRSQTSRPQIFIKTKTKKLRLSQSRKFPFEENLKGKERKETFHPCSKINADISLLRKEFSEITITKEQPLH
jgi:hypothetical protein